MSYQVHKLRMNDVLGHDFAPVRLYWAGDNLGEDDALIMSMVARSPLVLQYRRGRKLLNEASCCDKAIKRQECAITRR